MKRLLVPLMFGIMLIIPHTSGGAPAPIGRPMSGPEGKWRVEFANGVREACEVRNDRTASVVEPLRKSTGKMEAQGGSFVIRFADDRVERWTPVGPRFVVEHWFPTSGFPAAAPVLGIAERAR